MFEDIKKQLADNSHNVEKALSDYYRFADPDFEELTEAQKYTLLGGGKRIRAFLTIQFSKLFGGSREVAMPYACAVEMVHAYSLIHDDLPCMDNDDFRRGKPSNHKAYGEALALLAGDALLTNAFYAVSSNNAADALSNSRAVRILSENAGTFGMIGGQTIDIKAGKTAVDFEALKKLHSLKTGKLITAATLLGAVAAGVEEASERWNAAEIYGSKIGLAFQIVDDILEYEEGKKELNSFLAFMSLNDAKKFAEDTSDEAIRAIEKYDREGTLTSLAEYLAVRDH